MKIEWNGKRAIVQYDDGTYYDGQYNSRKGCCGIGTLYDAQNNVLSRGEWRNGILAKKMSEEEYNSIRKDW